MPARSINRLTAALLGSTALVLATTGAHAGGFAVREQSSLFLGLAFAGSAAGGSLSSMFWNPAATAELPGMNTDSNYSAIILDAEVHVDSATSPSAAVNALVNQAATDSGDIAPLAIVSASYANYQVNEKLYLGMGLNAPFGLKTEPEPEYQGSLLGRKTSLFTLNANPTLAYKITPAITIGAGVQIEYADAIFKFSTLFPQADSTVFSKDDWAFGATAGILIEPGQGTKIGLGWRSQMTHDFEGTLVRLLTAGPIPIPAADIGAEAELNLPDVITLSLRQAVSPTMRLMGTVEWSNWARFEELRLKATEAGLNPVTSTLVSAGDTIAVIDANWSDGWFFSLGGELDYSDKVTLRGGVAYEISPVDGADKRIVSIPDADRVWLSLGASYDYSAATTLDFSYTHIFVEDGPFERTTLGAPSVATSMTGEVEASADLLSVGMRTRW